MRTGAHSARSRERHQSRDAKLFRLGIQHRALGLPFRCRGLRGLRTVISRAPGIPAVRKSSTSPAFPPRPASRCCTCSLADLPDLEERHHATSTSHPSRHAPLSCLTLRRASLTHGVSRSLRVSEKSISSPDGFSEEAFRSLVTRSNLLRASTQCTRSASDAPDLRDPRATSHRAPRRALSSKPWGWRSRVPVEPGESRACAWKRIVRWRAHFAGDSLRHVTC